MSKGKTKKQPVKKARKYSVEKLGENSIELFGVSSFTFAGATYGVEGEYTVEEMKEIINNWLHEEV